TAVEIANHLTLHYGVSFRKAHTVAGRISRLVSANQLDERSLKQLFEEESVKVELDVEDVLSLMDAGRTVEAYAVEGSAKSSYVAALSRKMLEEVASISEKVVSEKERFHKTLSMLLQ
ncbi:MAG: hypothetical protein QXG75_01855, partial [Candidatus Caldarchaeum sp.]